MPFGYIGQNQTKQKVKNSGVLSSFEVSHLKKQGHAGGSLELISTTTISSSTTNIDLTSLQESKYSVHQITYDLRWGSGVNNEYLAIRVSNDGGSSFENSGYSNAMQYCGVTNSFGSIYGASETEFQDIAYGDAGDYIQGYIYLYNLGDSSKYSFTSSHSTPTYESAGAWTYFGGGVYTTAETINAIRLFAKASSGGFDDGTVKLFGVKQL